MVSPTQVASPPLVSQRRRGNPDIYAESETSSSNWPMPLVDWYMPEEMPESLFNTPLTEEELVTFSSLVSTFEAPVHDADEGAGRPILVVPTSHETHRRGDVGFSLSPPDAGIAPIVSESQAPLSPSAIYVGHMSREHVKSHESQPDHIPAFEDRGPNADPQPGDRGTNADSQPGDSSNPSTSLTAMRIAHFQRHSLDGQLTDSSPVSPSRRRSSLGSHVAHTNRPYPPCSARSFYQRHFGKSDISCPQLPTTRRATPATIAVIAGPLLELSRLGEVVRQEHHSSQVSPGQELTPLMGIRRVRSGGRTQVPLREWCPKRAPKAWVVTNPIEFWSKDNVNGQKISGTFLEDRFQEETGRTFLCENEFPFPEDKKAKGFNLRILWPGYPEFAKKISVHKSLSDCTLRDVRDWVFNALSDFIRTAGMGQEQGWRVSEDDPDAVHVDDLVLVRLRQVGKGTWVPDLDLWDWARVDSKQ